MLKINLFFWLSVHCHVNLFQSADFSVSLDCILKQAGKYVCQTILVTEENPRHFVKFQTRLFLKKLFGIL